MQSNKNISNKRILLGDQMLPIARLHLDPKNPRHNPLQSDAEIIKQLCNTEMISELAKDIAQRGELSPLDVLGAIPFEGHPGHYIAVEGNRRTCALILLSDPSRAPTVEMQKAIRRIATNAYIPAKIKVHVFKDRASAKPWIDLRHLGPQGGIGIREWNADQKTRAAAQSNKSSSRANELALSVLDHLERRNLLTSDQRKKVSLSTITRYLGSPGVRAIIGLASNRDIIYTHDLDEVDRALQQLVIDSINPDDDGKFLVNSRSSGAERVAYAASLKLRGIAPVTLLSSPVNYSNLSHEKLPAKIIKKRSARNPSNLPTLIDKSFTVVCKDSVLQRLRQEALKLPLEEFPFSANYLLRALIEQVMTLFLKKTGKYGPNMTDAQITQLCAKELEAMGANGKALTVVQKAAGSAAHPYSLHSLGHAVHGASIPTRQQLRAVCDTWQPSLQFMLNALEKEKKQ